MSAMKRAAASLQRLDIEHQDTDAPRHQQIADLVGGQNVPEPPCSPHAFAQSLQERVVGGQYDELDDVAREAEASARPTHGSHPRTLAPELSLHGLPEAGASDLAGAAGCRVALIAQASVIARVTLYDTASGAGRQPMLHRVRHFL